MAKELIRLAKEEYLENVENELKEIKKNQKSVRKRNRYLATTKDTTADVFEDMEDTEGNSSKGGGQSSKTKGIPKRGGAKATPNEPQGTGSK